MECKPSRFRKIRSEAQAMWEGHALAHKTHLSRIEKFAHFWILVVRSFARNRCPVRAAALAYVTLLALIPMLAVVVSVTSSFMKKQGEDQIDKFIVKLVASMAGSGSVRKNAPEATTNSPAIETAEPAALLGPGTNSTAPQTEGAQTPGENATPDNAALPASSQAEKAVKARKDIARSIHQFIQNTRSGALGVTGSVALIFVAISMLGRIEDTLNDIWGVARGRTWFARITIYWLVISLAPVLLIVALGLASGPHLAWTRKLLVTMPFVSNLMFEFLPIVVLCLTFALFYMLMPNAKVHWRAALAGGVVGGLLWHVNNAISVLYVSRVVSNSSIYGSLGLVPLFMIGLYFSWLILLFGAQVAYAVQNLTSYLEEKQVENINQRGREFIALRLMACIGGRFLRGEPPASTGEIAGQLTVPSRLVRQVMHTLGAARLVAEVAGSETAFLPARPLESITCHDILLAMRASPGQELATRDEPARAQVFGEFHRIEEAERQVASGVTLLDLVKRSETQVADSEVKTIE